MTRQKFYTALGQVLAYAAEHGNNAVPSIAIYSTELSDYILESCKKLKINLMSIDKLTLEF